MTKEAEKAWRYCTRLYSKYQGRPLTREDFVDIVGDRQLCVEAFKGTPYQEFVEMVTIVICGELERESNPERR